jgi:hypothetical protein
MQVVNPYAPPPSTSDNAHIALPQASGSRRNKWLRTILAAYALTVIIGLAIAAYDIGSIIGSGPVLLVIGTILAVIGFRKRAVGLALLGVSSYPLAGIIVALINIVPYSPTTGYWPLLTISGLYACISVPVAGWLLIGSYIPKENPTSENMISAG